MAKKAHKKAFRRAAAPDDGPEEPPSISSVIEKIRQGKSRAGGGTVFCITFANDGGGPKEVVSLIVPHDVTPQVGQAFQAEFTSLRYGPHGKEERTYRLTELNGQEVDFYPEQPSGRETSTMALHF